MAETAVYGLIAGLLELWGDADPEGDGVRTLTGSTALLFDGPSTSGEPDDYVAVGLLEPEESQRAADITQSWATMGNRGRDESGSVHCVIECWNGGGDMADARTATRAIFQVLGDALRDDPTVGGAVQWAGIVPTYLDQRQTQSGALVTAGFDVQYRHRLTRS